MTTQVYEHELAGTFQLLFNLYELQNTTASVNLGVSLTCLTFHRTQPNTFNYILCFRGLDGSSVAK